MSEPRAPPETAMTERMKREWCACLSAERFAAKPTMLAGASETKAEALAEIGGRPAAMKAGKVRNPEPPASALMKPAITPTAKRKTALASVIGLAGGSDGVNEIAA